MTVVSGRQAVKPPWNLSLLTPEERVLLLCARNELSPEHVAALERLPPDVDWDGVWKLAYVHGIDFFVGYHVHRLGLPVPPHVRARMQNELGLSAVWSLLKLDTQFLLAGEFERASVPVVWLKGMALSEQLYGSAAARQSADLDVLVDADGLAEVEKCLELHGFDHEPQPLDAHFMEAHHRVWTGAMVAGGFLTVEVHHRVAGPAACQPTAAEMVRGARRVRLGRKLIPVPSREHELLLLCLHAHHHNFGYLLGLMDVAEYARRFQGEIDWNLLKTVCREQHCSGRVGGALELAFSTLGYELPNEVVDFVEELVPRQRWAIRCLTPAALLQPGGDENDLRRLRLGLLMDRWQDVVALLSPHLLPPQAYARAQCPQPWRHVPGLAYVWHLGRVVWHFLSLA